MPKKKSDHKHSYELCYQDCGHGFYRLIQVCRICGLRKDPKYRLNLVKRCNGTWAWLCRKEEILEQYPGIREVD